MADRISVSRVIPAPPEPIFDLLADPSRHAEIDGSGTVQGARSGTRRLALGDSFGMSMRMGVAYSTRNVVVTFEENRRIAWQTHGPTRIGAFVGGRIWRYELEPVDGGTNVAESWDISEESWFTKPVVRLGANDARKNMTATLARIEEVLAG